MRAMRLRLRKAREGRGIGDADACSAPVHGGDFRYHQGMIYYVEDDTNIRELTVYALAKAGLEARGFPDARTFLDACEDVLPSLVLLDIMLPGIDGLELLGMIRSDSRMSDVPVMMLTAKGTEFDKVVGLDAGADDYLAKPFGMMEMVSRCKALLRRAGNRENGDGAAARRKGLLRCGPVELDPASREVRVGGTPVELTRKEFDLLRVLLENQETVLTRGQLLSLAWNTDFAGETRTVDAHVQTLRRKLNEALTGAGQIVQTVRGIGYRARFEGQR